MSFKRRFFRFHKLSHGFTLIELLVVISIIALLMAILIPALSKAKNLAQLLICDSNYKQIAMSIQTYTVDYEDYLPSNAWPSGEPLVQNGTWTGVGLMAPLHKYIDVTSKAWDCPADKENIGITSDSPNPWDWRSGYRDFNIYFRTRDDGTSMADPLPAYDTNYGTNPYLFSVHPLYDGGMQVQYDKRYKKPIKITKVKRPSSVWIIDHYVFPHYVLHMGTDSFVYLDTHVARLRPVRDLDLYRAWWYAEVDTAAKRLFR